MSPAVSEAPQDTKRPAEPPWSREGEQAVLGALLLDNGAMAMVSDLVTPASFYLHEHKQVFRAIVELLNARQLADVITVWEKLKSLEINDEGVACSSSVRRARSSAARCAAVSAGALMACVMEATSACPCTRVRALADGVAHQGACLRSARASISSAAS
jgi:replicative DNA helicase